MLPANAFVLAGRGPAAFLQIYKVQHNVIGTQTLLQLIRRDAACSDQDDLDILQHLPQVIFEQRSDMGNELFDVFTIGADEAAQRYIVIAQLELTCKA